MVFFTISALILLVLHSLQAATFFVIHTSPADILDITYMFVTPIINLPMISLAAIL